MKKILVIEDEAAMCRNLALMLELEGFEVRMAPNGSDGVAQARRWHPDLVLCDVMMPGLDGHGVIRELRSDPSTSTIPFVFLTARADRSDLRAGMNLGADDYLTKPVIREDLLAAVRTRLARAAAVDARVQQAAADAGGFHPDFSSPEPLRERLGLTPREAEVLLWISQGKSNADVGIILGMAEKTVKQHAGSIFQKLGVESRNAATLRALEILSTKGPSGS